MVSPGKKAIDHRELLKHMMGKRPKGTSAKDMMVEIGIRWNKIKNEKDPEFVARKPGAKKPGAKKPGARKSGARKPGARKSGA